ncbi:hypothetical protein AURDEDRAFT_163665 [Auricularia subglabra TFB-10046 SS5]|nr:hypothetical protein AURDEDRAFT_163665 [Auricularia subglabra TFB-10046 SS5]
MSLDYSFFISPVLIISCRRDVRRFAGPTFVSPAFAELFNPNGKGIKLETLALILAAVQNCVDEWAEGEFQEIAFTAPGYRKWYLHHLQRLEHYAKHKTLSAICARLRKDMYRAAMLRAGAIMPKVSTQIGITDDDLEAAAAFYAAGKAPSETVSESEEESLDDDNVPVLQHPRKKADQLLDASELAGGAEDQMNEDEDDLAGLGQEERDEMDTDRFANDDDDEPVFDADSAAITAAEDELFDIEDNFERIGAGGEYDDDGDNEEDDEDDENQLDDGNAAQDDEDDEEEAILPFFKRARLH